MFVFFTNLCFIYFVNLFSNLIYHLRKIKGATCKSFNELATKYNKMINIANQNFLIPLGYHLGKKQGCYQTAGAKQFQRKQILQNFIVRTDGRTDGRMDGRTDGPSIHPTDGVSYRGATSRLKTARPSRKV
jgi:hypothetical protein